jgi:TRAP-type C4-dicarboxylate transport system permease large subunit
MACVIMTTPIIFPIVLALGFDPVWYSVILVRMVEIGLITPPFGLNLFALAGAARVPVEAMYRGVIPFVAADMIHVTLLIGLPSLVTFLPSMM